MNWKKMWDSRKGQAGSSEASDDLSDDSTFVVTSKVNYYFVVLVLVVLAFVAFLLISNNYVNALVSVPKNVRNDLLIARVTNVCFTPEEIPFGYSRQNIIDVEQFTEQNLLSCFSDNPTPRMSLTLSAIDSSLFSTTEVFTGKGGMSTIVRPVLLKLPDQKLPQAGLLRVGLPS